jgi:hypothetical protein
MDMGHEIDMVVDTGIHHTWRSQDLNSERLWGTYVSIYWRKFGVFWWLDHRERGCELVALLLDRTGR